MVDFKVEFEEEKVGGLLLLYFITLLVFELILGIIVCFQFYRVLRGINIINTITLVICSIYLVFILFTMFSVFKIQRYMVKISKIFLIVRFFYLTICNIILYCISYSKNPLTFGNPYYKYKSIWDAILTEILIPMIYVVLYSAIWYVYFSKSKRFKKPENSVEKMV